MGGSLSSSSAAMSDFKRCNVEIAQVCDRYLDNVQEMLILADPNIEQIECKLVEIIEKFRSLDSVKALGRGAEPYVASIERYANYQKHSIRKIISIVEMSQDELTDRFSKILMEDFGQDLTTEVDILQDALLYCDGLVVIYERDLSQDPETPPTLLASRCLRLRKLLTRATKELMEDAVTTAIANKKELILDSVDETVRQALRSTERLETSQLKVLIDEILDLANDEIASFALFPVADFTLVDQACRDIDLHVRTLVRSIQLSALATISDRELSDCILLDNQLDQMLDELAEGMDDGYLKAINNDDDEAEDDIQVTTKKSPQKQKSKTQSTSDEETSVKRKRGQSTQKALQQKQNSPKPDSTAAGKRIKK